MRSFFLRDFVDSNNVEIDGLVDDRCFDGVRGLEVAGPQDVTFFDRGHLARQVKDVTKTKAGACFVKPEDRNLLPPHVVALITPHPYRSFIDLVSLVCPAPSPQPGVHATAVIECGAIVPEDCVVEAHAIVRKDVILGQGSWVKAGAVVGPSVVLGAGCVVHECAVVMHTDAGQTCHFGPGACVGKDGFGFLFDGSIITDIPHIGRVCIGNFVRIGAQSCIDRGSFQNTHIGDWVRIDNLVTIGHNVTIGRGVVIAAQTGVAGSSAIEEGCVLGGQVGVADHVRLDSGTRVAAKSGVMRSYGKRAAVAGIPAIPVARWHRHLIKSGYGRHGHEEK